MAWGYGCDIWREESIDFTEEVARSEAAKLDLWSACELPHYYWERDLNEASSVVPGVLRRSPPLPDNKRRPTIADI